MFLLLFEINSIFYRCGTDSIQQKPHIIDDKYIDNKRKLSTDYTPLNIKLDFTYLESQNLLQSKDLNDLKELSFIFSYII